MALKRLHLSDRTLHSIFFLPELEGSRFLKNISVCLPHHRIILQKTLNLTVADLRTSDLSVLS
jgi:hypothetical protein